MTPNQQKRHSDAMGIVASAPRKSWLGKHRPINSVQSAWVKSLLAVWGDCYGGRISEESMMDGCGFWSCLRAEEWSDNEAKRITETIKSLSKIGYKGEELLRMAREILWPTISLADVISKEIKQDDNDFVEKSILAALTKDDPVYVVGVDFYARRKKISDIGRYIQKVAPWLTRKQSEDRVRWCISHFNCAVFLSFRKAMRHENEKTIENE